MGLLSRAKHKIADFIVIRPSIIDAYVWLRMGPKAATLLNEKFNKKAPIQFRVAAEQDMLKWEFFEAAKFFLKLKPETAGAIFTHWFNAPTIDPKFKPSVLMTLWLTVPPIALVDELGKTRDKIRELKGSGSGDNAEKIKELEAKADRIEKDAEAKVNSLVDLISQANLDLTADFLINMQMKASILFLEKSQSFFIPMIMRTKVPFDTAVKLFYALRAKNPDRYDFILMKNPADFVGKVKMKMIEIDQQVIHEYRLKNEVMKYNHGELTHRRDEMALETEPIKQDAERWKYTNEKLKFEDQVERREQRREKKEDGIEEAQRKRQQNIEESLSNLLQSIDRLVQRWNKERE